MLIPKRRPKARRFQYEPRFYDPGKDERMKRRLRFDSKTRRGKQPAFIIVGLLLVLALYIYTKL